MMNRVTLATLALALVTDQLAAQAAQDTPVRATFVTTQGGDTLAVERISRSTTRVESDLAVRAQGVRLQFSLALGSQELVSSMELAVRMGNANDDAPPVQTGTLTFRGDSVVAEMTTPARSTHRVAAGVGVLPFVNLSMAVAEQMVRRARVLGGTQVKIPVFVVGGGQALPAVVTWSGRDTAVIALGGVELRAAVAPDGYLVGHGSRGRPTEATDKRPLPDEVG